MKKAANKQAEQKASRKLQWFFFVFLIPLIFAGALTFGVLKVAGYNPIQLVKDHIPGVSTVAATANAKQEKSKDLKALNATIKQQKEALSQSESQLKSKQTEIDSYLKKIEDLTNQLKTAQITNEQATIKGDELVNMYETMDPAKAAAILSNVDKQDAIDLLLHIQKETSAAIMSEMDPADAAELTVLLNQQTKQIKK
ncbi:MotE family protein [Bacillus tianshenii]|nr:MotE family protein [Bacillus tianshenii]